jgi:hypothetical protein
MSTSEVKERKKLQSFTVTPKLKIGNFTQKKSEIENSQSLSKAQKAIQIQKIQEERRGIERLIFLYFIKRIIKHLFRKPHSYNSLRLNS